MPKKLLLHTCCAPCLTHPLTELEAQGYDVTIFYYNPNIHPRKEYKTRFQETKKYLAARRSSEQSGERRLGDEYDMRITEARKYLSETRRSVAKPGENRVKIIEGEYENQAWFELTKGHEDDPERGERCRICYEMRLAKTAQHAVEEGFQAFGSTLSISPHKNATWLNEIGQELSEKYGIDYLESDWKKCDGFKKSLELSKKSDLRRQSYCGCVYSKIEREKLDKKI